MPTDQPAAGAGNVSPTAFISYAQSAPKWSDEQKEAWMSEVLEFASTLLSMGVDAEVDQFHFTEKGMDWNRFGTQAVRTSDTVIIATSLAYKQRFEGTNKPTEGAGAVREADAILGLLNRDQQLFRDKVVVVVLPSASGADVPNELSGHHRFDIKRVAPDDPGLVKLYRLLTDQPAVTKPPLGDLRVLDATPDESQAEDAAELDRLRAHRDRLAHMLSEVDPIEVGLVERGRRALPQHRGLANALAEEQRVVDRIAEIEASATESADTSKLAAEDVLAAIRAAGKAARDGVVQYADVAKRLGCRPDDPTFQRLLARAKAAGLIEEVASVDQLPGPILFRIADGSGA